MTNILLPRDSRSRQGKDDFLKKIQLAMNALGGSQGLAVMLLDVDYLMHHNDIFGHSAGDAALNSIWATLSEKHHVFRFGGDEFALCRELPSYQATEAVCEQLRRQVLELKIESKIHKDCRGTPRSLTVSVGGVFIDKNYTEGLDSLISELVSAVHDAKCAGRNCFKVNSLVSV